MNSTKHTPGPWTARKAPKRNAYAWDVEGARGTVPTIARMGLVDRVSEVEANAHLIAAAPAMYEALKLATWLTNKCDCHEAWNVPEGNLCGRCTAELAIKTALAQVDGE